MPEQFDGMMYSKNCLHHEKRKPRRRHQALLRQDGEVDGARLPQRQGCLREDEKRRGQRNRQASQIRF